MEWDGGVSNSVESYNIGLGTTVCADLQGVARRVYGAFDELPFDADGFRSGEYGRTSTGEMMGLGVMAPRGD